MDLPPPGRQFVWCPGGYDFSRKVIANPVNSEIARLRKVPINTYSVCFLELKG